MMKTVQGTCQQYKTSLALSEGQLKMMTQRLPNEEERQMLAKYRNTKEKTKQRQKDLMSEVMYEVGSHKAVQTIVFIDSKQALPQSDKQKVTKVG